MNIVTWAVLFIGLATIGPIGLGQAQGTMSGMTNSMRSSPLMAPAGQGQGPHDIGKEITTADQVPSGNSEGRSDSSQRVNPGNSSGTASSGVGASARGDPGGAVKGRARPADENSGGAAPMLR